VLGSVISASPVAGFSEGAAIWLEALPARTYQTPQYGEVAITKDRLDRMVSNFKDNVRGQEVATDFDHGIVRRAIRLLAGTEILKYVRRQVILLSSLCGLLLNSQMKLRRSLKINSGSILVWNGTTSGQTTPERYTKMWLSVALSQIVLSPRKLYLSISARS
jgi:hypothetical protein